MIDILTEKLIRLIDVPDYLPSCRKGKKLGKAICFGWKRKGARGIKLETIRVGGARLTSVEALQRWVEAQNEAEYSPRKGLDKKAKERAEKAAEGLAKLGI